MAPLGLLTNSAMLAGFSLKAEINRLAHLAQQVVGRNQPLKRDHLKLGLVGYRFPQHNKVGSAAVKWIKRYLAFQ